VFLQLTNLSKEEQEAKMESLIDEFGLEHIRTNEC
jgi:lipopolysaccharide export system ATP-binding protein